MHIVLVSADSGLGGLPRHIELLADGLVAENDVVSVIAPEGPLLERLRASKRVELVPLPFRSRFDLSTLFGLRRIYKAISSTPDLVIHLHGLRAGLLGRLAAFGLALPIVYTEHLWTEEYLPPAKWRQLEQLFWLRLLNRVTRRTIVVSQAVKRFFLKHHICQPEQLSVVYHGLPGNLPLAQPKGSQPPIIGFVGALNPVKRLDVLIRAAGLLWSDEVDFRLEVVGDGPERQASERLVRDLGIEAEVAFLGAMADPELAMLDFTLLAVPSDSESFSLVALEAAAMGVPVVASRVGGLPEVVKHDKTGLLVPPADPPALKRAIAELLADPGRRDAMRSAAKDWAREFTVARMVAETRAVYQAATS